MERLTVGSLFSGIGGIELGLERTGQFETKWQVEIDDYCKRILAKQWPEVTRYEDIRDVGSGRTYPLSSVDLLCGGFPCQEISEAGKRTGLAGARSGLWREYSRVICDLQPRYVLVENVAALIRRGIDTILRDLAEAGYDAVWQSLPACAFGAPHQRERLFIIAYSRRIGREWHWANTPSPGCFWTESEEQFQRLLPQHLQLAISESRLYGVVDGVSARMDRIKVLGNAVMPQVAEWIGQQIIQFDNAS